MRLLRQLARWWNWLLLAGAAAAALLALALLLAPRLGLVGPPRLEWSMPADGAANVLPRTPLRLIFSEPMDRASVERALRVEPPLAGGWQWDGARSATWTPEPGWTTATTFTITLDAGARSRWRQPLAAAPPISFGTTSAPEIAFRWPGPGGALASGQPLVLRFSRSMLALPDVAARGLPELTLDPPAPLGARWIDQQTAVVTAALAPGRAYTATLAGLADEAGVGLAPSAWRFAAAPLPIIASAPAAGSSIAPSAPLSLTVAGALRQDEIDALTASLRLEPAQPGRWSAAAADAWPPRTALLFQPDQPWRAGTTYTATLAGPATAPLAWSWQARAGVGIVGTVPGRNGSIAPTDELRVIFTRPPDAAIAQAVSITPPVEGLVSEASGDQLRIRGGFVAGATYTLTIKPADQPLIELPFTISGRRPAMRIAAPAGDFSIWRPETIPQLSLAWSGLAQAALTLYPLDRAQLATLLAAPATGPDRLQLAPIRSWRIDHGGPLDAEIQTLIQLPEVAGTPASGYLLTIAGLPGGLRLQHVAVVSPYAAHTVASAGAAHIWVTDARQGTPAADLELTLLRGGSQIAQGRTDDDGAWSAPLPAGRGQIIVLAGPGAPPLAARIVPPAPPPAARLAQAQTDRNVYLPGDQLRVAGQLIRQSPAAGAPLSLELVAAGSQQVAAAAPADLDAGGAFSGTLAIRPSTTAGPYLLRLLIGGAEIGSIPLAIGAAPSPLLAIDAPAVAQAGAAIEAVITARTAAGQADAGRLIEWAALAADGQPLQSGAGKADGGGQLAISLAPPAAPGAVTIRASSQGRQRSQQVLIRPELTVRLAAAPLLARPGQTVTISATVLGGDGRPPGATPLDITIATNGASERLRRTTTVSGTLSFSWRVRASGETRISLRAGGIESAPLTIWAAAPGFAGWLEVPPTELALVADQQRPAVSPLGGAVKLLPRTTARQGTLHLVWTDGQALQSLTRPWQAGEFVDWAMPAGAAESEITALLLTLENGQPRVRRGALRLQAAGADQLSLAVSELHGGGGRSLVVRASQADGSPADTRISALIREHGDQAPAPGAEPTSPLSLTGAPRIAGWLPLAPTAGGALTIPLELPPGRLPWEVRLLDHRSGTSAALLLTPTLLLEPVWALPETALAGDLFTATLRIALPAGLAGPPGLLLAASAGLELPAPPISATVAGRFEARWPIRAAQPGTQQISATLAAGGATLVYTSALEIGAAPRQHSRASTSLATGAQTRTLELPAGSRDARLELAAAPAAADLIAFGQRSLAGSEDLLAAAARLATAPAPAPADLALVAASQRKDGGWAWAVDSDPLLTALILELLANRRLADSEPILARATTYLQARLPLLTDPDRRAAALLALARRRQPVGAQIRELLRRPDLSLPAQVALVAALDASGAGAEARGYLPALIELAARPPGQDPPWLSRAHSTARLGRLLLRLDAEPQAVRRLAEALAAEWDGSGWGQPLATAEALLLLDALPPVRLPADWSLRADGQPVAGGSAPAALSLPVSASITIRQQSASALPLALRLSWDGPGPAYPLGLLAADTGAGTEDGYNGRLGEPVEAGWWLIVPEPLPYAELQFQPPAGLIVDGIDAEGFVPGERRFALRAARLEPGVYWLRLRGRPGVPGRMAWAPPTVSAAGLPGATGAAPVWITVRP